jgi:hypothetical protein
MGLVVLPLAAFVAVMSLAIAPRAALSLVPAYDCDVSSWDWPILDLALGGKLPLSAEPLALRCTSELVSGRRKTALFGHDIALQGST